MDGHNEPNPTTTIRVSDVVEDAKRRPSALKLNPEDYAADMSKFDIPEGQRQEFLETLWNIMVMCVDLGFGVDAVSLACGQNGEPAMAVTDRASDMVNLREKFQNHNNEEKGE